VPIADRLYAEDLSTLRREGLIEQCPPGREHRTPGETRQKGIERRDAMAKNFNQLRAKMGPEQHARAPEC
jgi:hypothetical protein